jgi:hypothetical protein
MGGSHRGAQCLYVFINSLFPQIYGQLVTGQPLWVRLFYLVRTGHIQEALDEALRMQPAIEHREAGFVHHFRTWAESSDRRYFELDMLKAERESECCCVDYPSLTGTISNPYIMLTCFTLQRLIPSSWPYIS